MHKLFEPSPELLETLLHDMEQLSGIEKVDDLHVWRRDAEITLAARIVIGDLKFMEEAKTSLKAFLANRYDIHHSFLEFEKADSGGVSMG